MIIFMGMMAGALTSAAWVAPKPWCYAYALVASVFFVLVKQAQ